jgi:DNA-binding CsgD family transcriptional regulator
MPLTLRQSRSRLMNDAVAAVFIAEGEVETQMGDALGLKYGLTPMQSRVFELVASGLSSRKIVETLGIAPSTFKSHLLQVFEKTGIRRRTELAVLAQDIFR